MKLVTTLDQIAERMADSILDYARHNNVSLNGVTVENFNSFFDDAFDDGGEARCESFCDLGWEYAQQFGKFEDENWSKAQWRAVKAGLKALIKKLK